MNSHYSNTLDPTAMLRLKADLKNPTPEAAREVAQQFEALFVQTMLKSMRAAMPGDALLGGQQEAQYQSLFDQQLAADLARSRGFGLAPIIEQQLLTNMGLDPDQAQPQAVDASLNRYRRPTIDSVNSPALGDKGPAFESPKAFVDAVWQAAERAAKRLGVATKALVAQAALETGWGRHVIRRGDGESSHNLFGIKAHGWRGDSVKVNTLEYRDGVAAKELASFRAYGSLQDSFDDYVRFIENNPRYQKARDAAADAERYLHELQEAGYATDPAYAEKISRIMQSPELSRREDQGGGAA